MSPIELLQWQNLVFLLPGVASIFYLVVLSITGVGGDADHDVCVEQDVDTDVDQDMGAEHSHDFGHEGDMDQSVFVKMMSFLGIGRVPLSIIILTFCILWAFLGWASNLWLSRLGLPAFMYFWMSLAIAFFGSAFLTKAIASIVHRWMPNTETYVTRKTDLVGKTGITKYPVTEGEGYALVTDNYGGSLEVSCRIERGQEIIPSGTKVVLKHYQSDCDVFIVCPDPLTALIAANEK